MKQGYMPLTIVSTATVHHAYTWCKMKADEEREATGVWRGHGWLALPSSALSNASSAARTTAMVLRQA